MKIMIKPKLVHLYEMEQHIPTFDQQVFTKSLSKMEQLPISEVKRWIKTKEQYIIQAAKQEKTTN
jgi:hypothetical protein